MSMGYSFLRTWWHRLLLSSPATEEKHNKPDDTMKLLTSLYLLLAAVAAVQAYPATGKEEETFTGEISVAGDQSPNLPALTARRLDSRVPRTCRLVLNSINRIGTSEAAYACFTLYSGENNNKKIPNSITYTSSSSSS